MDSKYDVIVVGAGHAGCEAALACARMGARTLLMTMNLSTVAQMSCNPAIGGLAKSHLVKEIDALGGQMGVVTDDAGIQFRMLNRSKGPAVWSPRAQVDRLQYSVLMKSTLEKQENLQLMQASAEGLVVRNGKVRGVKSGIGRLIEGRCIIITPGTFLNGLIHIGLASFPGGRSGEFPARGLTESLQDLGFHVGRLKTGTPPRIDGNTVNWSALLEQGGDEAPEPFSHSHEELGVEQLPCFLGWTNQNTHEILRSGLDRSPLYTGKIVGIGPRYCPSVEIKIVRFSEKSRHQIFLEPEGRNTREYYVNGFATSLPEDIQIAALRSISGLENVHLTRLGYAIEYDFVPPVQLQPNLETKQVENLFLAGQINGTSGYEEAAAQGVMAGINAVLKIRREEPFILGRSEAYIGVLVDDLVTKDISEPYRMFTSLAEYRLILRQDNADLRLLDYAEKCGIASQEFCVRTRRKKEAMEDALEFLRGCRPSIDDVNPILEANGSSPVENRTSLHELLRRPELTIEHFQGIARHDVLQAPHDRFRKDVRRQVEIEIKYEGFIRRQKEQVARFRRQEEMLIPEDLNYSEIASLSAESREKLSAVRPVSLGQASRIAGVRQGDISVLMVHLAKRIRQKECST